MSSLNSAGRGMSRSPHHHSTPATPAQLSPQNSAWSPLGAMPLHSAPYGVFFQPGPLQMGMLPGGMMLPHHNGALPICCSHLSLSWFSSVNFSAVFSALMPACYLPETAALQGFCCHPSSCPGHGALAAPIEASTQLACRRWPVTICHGDAQPPRRHGVHAKRHGSVTDAVFDAAWDAVGALPIWLPGVTSTLTPLRHRTACVTITYRRISG